MPRRCAGSPAATARRCSSSIANPSVEQYRALAAALPGVVLHYALKPLPYPAVVADAASTSAPSFDLATTAEIDLVRSLRVSPERCIHTHPIKRTRHPRSAALRRRRFVVDNPDEVRKFAPYRRRAQLLLRVSFRNPAASSTCPASSAASRAAVRPLLELAQAPRHPRPRPVVSRRLAGGGPGPLRRGDRRLPRAHRRGRAATATSSTCSTSAAGFRSTTAARCSRSARSARRSGAH